MQTNTNFDGIISSMTMDHIDDMVAFFKKALHAPLNRRIYCPKRLDKENGTFHSDNTGVYHFGFDRSKIKVIAKRVDLNRYRFKP